MGVQRKDRTWVQFLQNYPVEGEPEYKKGQIRALPEPFASRLISYGYAKARKFHGEETQPISTEQPTE